MVPDRWADTVRHKWYPIPKTRYYCSPFRIIRASCDFLCSNMDCPVNLEVPRTTGFFSHSLKTLLKPWNRYKHVFFSLSLVAEAVYPTLNLSACAHPETCTGYLDAEKKLKGGDGLFAGRFQFMCSEPVFPHVDDIKVLDQKIASLERLFLAISVLHSEPLLYTYDSEAEKLIKSCYDNIQDFLKENHQKDSFLCGKYVLSVCVLLHARACDY